MGNRNKTTLLVKSAEEVSLLKDHFKQGIKLYEEFPDFLIWYLTQANKEKIKKVFTYKDDEKILYWTFRKENDEGKNVLDLDFMYFFTEGNKYPEYCNDNDLYLDSTFTPLSWAMNEHSHFEWRTALFIINNDIDEYNRRINNALNYIDIKNININNWNKKMKKDDKSEIDYSFDKDEK